MAIRVLVVSEARQAWGAELSAMALAGPLQRRGIDLVLGSPPGGELEARWRALGLEHVALALAAHRGMREPGGSGVPSPGTVLRELAATSRTVPAVARAARSVDLVHSNSLWLHLDNALAGRLAHRPVVLELHDMVAPGTGRRILRLAVRLSSASAAISDAVARCVTGPARKRVTVIPQALDLERFRAGPADPEVRRELTSDPDAPLVGIVGRVDPEKGIDLVIEAMARSAGVLARSHLVVVGSRGVGPPEYESAVRRRGAQALGERIRFVGRQDDVAPVLRALDVLVNASVSEPFGLSVLEAQATGIPVVAMASGGVPEFVTDGDNGVLVERREPALLAQALERVVGDAEWRAQLARRGRESARSRHGIEQRADALAQLYRAVISRRRPRATGPAETGG